MKLKYLGKTNKNFIKGNEYELIDFYNGYPNIEIWVNNEKEEIIFLHYNNVIEYNKMWEEIK
jgi:hypothetical protein